MDIEKQARHFPVHSKMSLLPYNLAALPPWLLFAGQFSHILPSCVFIFSLISNDFFFIKKPLNMLYFLHESCK
jgi:hypothetical protein